MSYLDIWTLDIALGVSQSSSPEALRSAMIKYEKRVC